MWDRGWKGVILGRLIYTVKKSFRAKHTLKMISWVFQPCPIFSIWCFQRSSLYFREEVRSYCMKLGNVVPLDPLPVSHHHFETKNMVNIHSSHNGRIPLNQINHREIIFIAANAEWCVSCTNFRLHWDVCPSSGELRSLQGASSFLLWSSHIGGSGCLLLS